jgi:hypothetical protein
VGVSLIRLGIVAQLQSEWDQATRLHQESLSLYRQSGNTWGIATSLACLGEVALAEQKWEQAANYYRESLNFMQATGSQWYIALALLGMSGVWLGLGQAGRAASLLGAVEAVIEAIGGTLPPFDRRVYERNTAAVRSALGEAAFTTALAQGRLMALEEALADTLRIGD